MTPLPRSEYVILGWCLLAGAVEVWAVGPISGMKQ
jgi:hypothetical protein